ncbi:6,7-dimethyl-8-ribityllumazine synthase [Plastoroseomonas arctica]|uniref:6,7-dimethyl-8-ribityllumazine synthase n=1 Tax=Plastoroseomonas arctica TaxID=1509237 RepID=A0AAF1JW40_9PROT|nr:6,7-dimethyl-8-ribityllumazine synthase [Plastoroseomonas arctica]MBR0655066.1 6,7-dimethyl-8-ribityllumazine synthase [Plastoroseomonas arctica]
MRTEGEAKPLALMGAAPRILVIQAPYYRTVVEGMRLGAERALAPLNAEVEVAEVAGAFELPAALRLALEAQGVEDGPQWDGFLVLGCVVKGETDHYDFICQAVCKGIMDISTETGAPIGFGLLTVDTLAQAEARSADDQHNKGIECAAAVVGQIKLARLWGLQ